MDLQKDEDFEKAWQENRHIWESTKNLAKAMFYAGQAKAQAIPEGFVVVPKKPTQKLYRAFYDAFNSANAGNTAQCFKVAYKAMIEAVQEQTND